MAVVFRDIAIIVDHGPVKPRDGNSFFKNKELTDMQRFYYPRLPSINIFCGGGHLNYFKVTSF